jgi:hypothetical protein
MTTLSYENKHCLRFFYHMWGNDIGALNILTKSQSGTTSLPFWTRNKNYGDEWNLGEVTVMGLTTTDMYQIVFEGVVGDSWEGDIAIDDVTVETTECRPPGFCDFDRIPRLCSWSNVQSK